MITRQHIQRRALTWVGAGALVVIVAGGTHRVWAQTGEQGTAKKAFTKTATFHLPVHMDARTRESLKEICLYVKSGGGDWVRQEAAPPTIPHFRYTVPQDGEYWFSLVTIDKAGKPNPADVAASPPDQMVVVDTRPPTIEVLPLISPSGETCLRCVILDPNPDWQTLRVVHVTPNGDKPLAPVANMPGVFRPFSPELQKFPVRVSAADLSGNKAMRSILLKDLVSATAATAKTLPDAVVTQGGQQEEPVPVNPPALLRQEHVQAANNPLVSQPKQEPMLPATTVQSATPPKQEPVLPVANLPAASSKLEPVQGLLPNVPMPPLPDDGAGHGNDAAMARSPGNAAGAKQVLNTTRASLEYRIDGVGPSGVGKVDIYLSTDQGNSWQKIGEDSDRRSPAEIDLPGEGQFGIRLAVTNGNGFGGGAPARGDQAASIVEVDTTNPSVQLRPIEPVPQNGGLDIRWSASDRNLGPEPVNLYYRTRADAPWQPIARNIKNEGAYRWSFPREVQAQFFLKVEVIDIAGNVGRAETPNPVLLDMTEPRAIVVNVTPVGPR